MDRSIRQRQMGTNSQVNWRLALIFEKSALRHSLLEYRTHSRIQLDTEFGLKLLAELCLCATNLGDEKFIELVQEIGSEADSTMMLDSLARNPFCYRLYLPIFFFLGLRDEAFKAAYSKGRKFILKLNMPILEPDAMRRLDGEHCLNINEIHREYKKETLNQCLDIIYNIHHPRSVDRGTIYAITHIVFYITEFGSKKTSLGDRILDFFADSGDLCYLSGDVDLLSEIAMSLAFLGEKELIHNHWIKAIQEDAFFLEVNIDFRKRYHRALTAIWALSAAGFSEIPSRARTYCYRNEVPILDTLWQLSDAVRETNEEKLLNIVLEKTPKAAKLFTERRNIDFFRKNFFKIRI